MPKKKIEATGQMKKEAVPKQATGQMKKEATPKQATGQMRQKATPRGAGQTKRQDAVNFAKGAVEGAIGGVLGIAPNTRSAANTVKQHLGQTSQPRQRTRDPFLAGFNSDLDGTRERPTGGRRRK